MAAILDRVKLRLPEEDNTSLLGEYVDTATDRIKLRLGEDNLPSLFESICVDVVVKLYRRQYYEGITSESADTLNTSFVNDVLSEYDNEFDTYIKNKDKKLIRASKKVRFI